MNKLAVIVLLIGLTACTGKKPEEGREPLAGTSGPVIGSAAPGPGAPGAPSAGSAPTAAGSAAGDPATGGAAAAPPGTIGCATAMTLTCEAGQKDGCSGGLTAVHVCVAADAKAGPPCAQEVALTCPDGQIDACLRNPPLANHHVCVFVPKPS